MKRIVFLLLLMIFCSGCSFNKDIKIPSVDLYDDFVDCNQDYIVVMRRSDDGSVIHVIQEGTVISQLQCDAEPIMVAVGQNSYYLLDEWERTLFIVNFDSEIIAKKKIPKDVDTVFCRNGFVFLGKYSEKNYLGQMIADYFFAEDNFTEDVQTLTQENIDMLPDITFYKSYEGYTTEPVLENLAMFYENGNMQGKELLARGEEYAFLQESIMNEKLCYVVEHQEGYQIYGWINCYDESYRKSLAKKQNPSLSSITKGIAYRINTQNGKTEILEEREEGILFSSGNKIVYMQNDGKILCHDINQETIKEVICVDNELPCINLKKDLIIWYGDDIYEDGVLPHIVRY
ncbi:MAG: hypothetical protein NC489_45995 [Ruminococcus flavefaciens]|nr:hypothetical protein [Ruminococcus flavefaciens]